MKKALSIIICTVLLFSSFIVPVNGAARTDKNYGNWIGYENSDGTLTITGCRALSEFLDNIIEIPETVEGKRVTGIGLYCGESSFYVFSHSYDIKGIVLPDTVEYVEPRIEDNWPYTSVFGSFTGLEEIVLPNNKNFDLNDAENLFNHNNTLKKLRTITCYDSNQLSGLAESVLDYDSNFESLEEITFAAPDAEEIDFGDYGDYYTSLKTININSAKTIYLDGLNIEKLNINEAANVRALSISGLNNLETLDIPESVRKLELSYCESLINVNYQGDIKNLSVESLCECPKVNMPVVYVRYYEDSSFRCTSYLGHDYPKSPYVNSQIQEIHVDSQRLSEYKSGVHSTKYAFRKMPALKRIVINNENPMYYTKDDILYFRSEDYNMLVAYPAAKSNGGNFNVPEDVTFICCFAFECSTLDTITIPENISDLYEWDDYYDEDEYDDYVIITDFFDGKIRMTENSAAYESWPGSDSKVILYRGEAIEPSTHNPETTDPTTQPVTENPEVTDTTVPAPSEQPALSTEATESSPDEIPTDGTTDKPTEPAETTLPSADTQEFRYLPSKEQLAGGDTIKLVVKDTDGKYHIVEMTATPEIYDGTPVYTAALPADITPELVQFQIYQGEVWQSQVSLTAGQYNALRGKLINSEGKAYGEEQPTTAQPKPTSPAPSISSSTLNKYKSLFSSDSSKTKKTNTMKVKVKKKTVSAKKLKKKKVTVKALYVTKAKGKVTYSKEFGDSALKINKTTGKITVKKRTKKGTYSMYVIVKAKGNSNYKAKKVSKLVTVKVK